MEQIEVYQREVAMLRRQLRHTLRRLHNSKQAARENRDNLRRKLKLVEEAKL